MRYQPAHSAEEYSAVSYWGRPAAHMVRRTFLTLLAGGTLAALGLELDAQVASRFDAGAVAGGEAAVGAVGNGAPAASRATNAVKGRVPLLSVAKVSPDSVVNGLPGTGNLLALTVDDGTSSEVVGAYCDFIKKSGMRITFFPNGRNPSWTDHAPALRPLVESGQVQLGNHTWSHPDLTRLSDADIADEISRNEAFLNNTYGVSGRPFLRPPYGFHNNRVDSIAAGLGYTTMTMWYGSLGDSSVLTPDQVLANARTWFTAQRIVIGHANHHAVTERFDQLAGLIHSRQLQTVTLDDVFLRA